MIFVFLCKNASAVGKALMPEELEGKIRGVVGWEQAKLAIPTQ